MGWTYLALAIATEVAATVSLKLSDGFSRLVPSVVVVVGYGVSFVLLAATLRHLSLGVTYAVWSGVGTAAIALIGVVVLEEPLTALQAASIGLIVAGVVGLNATGGH
jgi:small multidrug resistance pump